MTNLHLKLSPQLALIPINFLQPSEKELESNKKRRG